MEPVAWRYRYETKTGVWGKWTVQKNKPAWWREGGYADTQLEPLYTAPVVTDEMLKSAEAVIFACRHVYSDKDLAKAVLNEALGAGR